MLSPKPADVRFFRTPAEFRAWLAKHHASANELWVGFHKKDTGKPSITWPESVDEALCVGWIDGIRKRIDDESYVIRFTPRKPGSTWSTVNTRRAEVLTRDGRMQEAGLLAFENRRSEKSGIYLFEQKEATLSVEFEKEFQRKRDAWKFFESQPPGYRRIAIGFVMAAKREETRQRRLAQLIDVSSRGERLPQISVAKKKP